MVFSTRRFVVCLSLCHFVLVFFSSFSIAITSLAITSLGEERANLSAFRTFVRFVFVWICRFPLPLGVWEGLRFVIVALPGLFSYFFVIVALPGLFSYLFLYNEIRQEIIETEHVKSEKKICELSFTKTIISGTYIQNRSTCQQKFGINLQGFHIYR